MRCYIPPKPLTEQQEQRIQKRAIRDNTRIMKYADHLTCLSLRENAGFGRARFDKYNAAAFDLGRHYIEWYGQHDKDDSDYAKTGYYAIERDLSAGGWEPEENLWNDSALDNFPPTTNSASKRIEHAARLEYAKGISFYVRELLCFTALYLREECGYAETRLNRVLRPVAEAYLELMRLYLLCSSEGDAEMVKRINATKKEFDEMGIFKETP